MLLVVASVASTPASDERTTGASGCTGADKQHIKHRRSAATHNQIDAHEVPLNHMPRPLASGDRRIAKGGSTGCRRDCRCHVIDPLMSVCKTKASLLSWPS